MYKNLLNHLKTFGIGILTSALVLGALYVIIEVFPILLDIGMVAVLIFLIYFMGLTIKDALHLD